MTHFRSILSLVVTATGLLLILFALWMNTFHIEKIEGRLGDEKSYKAIELPWMFNAKGISKLKMELHHWMGSSSVWHITPDDKLLSIKINKRFVNLSDIPKKSLSDYNYGFKIDLSKYLRLGKNRIEVKIRNFGGPGKLTITPHFSVTAQILLILGFICILVSLSRLFKITRVQLFILFAGCIFLVKYWSQTPWDVRTHDTTGDSGHYAYVMHIIEKKSLPAPNEGWTYYHPPLYYLSAAGVASLANIFYIDNTILLQSYSLFLWFIFLLAALATLNVLLKGAANQTLIASSVALVTWPSGIIHSIRLGNDSAFYALSGIILYLMVRWWQSDQRRLLILCSLFCCLALLAKSNGIILCAVLGFAILYRLIQAESWKKRWQRVYEGSIAAIFFCVGIVASFATRIYYYNQGKIGSWLVSNSNNLNHKLQVPNDIQAFFPLDIPTFICYPFTSAWNDDYGRLNFWNYLLKSSLTGEFQFAGVAAAVIGVAMGILLLLILIRSAAPLIKLRCFSPRQLDQHFPLTAFIILSLTALIILRIDVPYSCSGDFRYIIPTLPAILYFTCTAARLNRILHYILAALSGLLVFTIS